MTIYSHSRLSNYKDCPFKFKLKYIDGMDEGTTIEQFLGSKVHEVLHYIYDKVKSGKTPTLKQVLKYYTNLWKKEYTREIRIVKKDFSARYYFVRGEQLIKQYYRNHVPFDENVIALEQEIKIDLDGKGKYLLRGFIDKLIYNKESGNYEIHDYKTGNWLKSQEELDNDNQLALYSLGVKEMFSDAEKIDLIWYFLAHEEKLSSSRTDQQLEKLKEEIINLIKEIESTTEWPAKESTFCRWCGFNTQCPLYKKQDSFLGRLWKGR